MEREYMYFDRQIVRVGDRVRVYGQYDGVVEEVVMPGTKQAQDCGCPDGYVCTSIYREGVKGSRLWTPPDGEFWEDLELVDRLEASGKPCCD
jgi:hypothetical protein